MYELKISEAGKNDLVSSSEWYEEQREGLGSEFKREVFTTLKYIQKNPLLYPIKFSGKFRFARTNRFPFIIGYEISGETIFINFIFHTSRNPTKF